MTAPDGRVSHAEMKIGDSIIMMGEPTGESKSMPGMIYLYLYDTDATYKRVLQAGATSLREPTDMFYGDRNAAITDPVGNQWWIAISCRRRATRRNAMTYEGSANSITESTHHSWPSTLGVERPRCLCFIRSEFSNIHSWTSCYPGCRVTSFEHSSYLNKTNEHNDCRPSTREKW